MVHCRLPARGGSACEWRAAGPDPATNDPARKFRFCRPARPARQLGADGWLLYDFHGINPPRRAVLRHPWDGDTPFFRLVAAEGTPVALAHRIELASFDRISGEVRPYAAWRELHDKLRRAGRPADRRHGVSPAYACVILDRVPHGVVELFEGFGARVVCTGTLITRFAARWSRASGGSSARGGSDRRHCGGRVALGRQRADARRGSARNDGAGTVMDAFGRAGLVTDHRPSPAFMANSAIRITSRRRAPIGGSRRAMCCYSISGPGSRWEACSPIRPGWRSPDASRRGVRKVWESVRGARDAASHYWGPWKQHEPVTGAALDDAARA